ncbi:MAG: demethoxyubiquinone hydroxylase family protein [Robiginitomaculum sp.]|nr:MAG: demethoxyubiquinone hydroxylase family protein [Robiginitomaculum sp.]
MTKAISARPASPGGSKHVNVKHGKTSPRIAEMLRVDHAGEYAAVAIYSAQAKVFSRSPKTRKIAAQLKDMCAEEQEHLDAFDILLREHNARPTALIPIWKLASTALGVTTALMGEKAAHACTEAVESVIEQHYAAQIEETKETDKELCARFTQFREDELRHRDFAVQEGAKDAPAYPVLSAFIKAGCRTAIRLSEKI